MEKSGKCIPETLVSESLGKTAYDPGDNPGDDTGEPIDPFMAAVPVLAVLVELLRRPLGQLPVGHGS